MGFWIFMFIMNLLIPAAMLGFGRYFRNKAPKEINMVFGYRTSMSMKNEDTWKFAHRHFGKVWYTAGKIMLPLTVAAMLLVYGKDTDTVGGSGGIICMAHCVILLVCIIPTELALRKTFDKDGNRKE